MAFSLSEYLLSAGFICITFISLTLATKAFQRTNGFPLFHPLITASLFLIICLQLFNIETQTYMEGTSLLVYLLAPATIALGVPLYTNFHLLLKHKRQLILPLLVGAIVSPASAIGILLLFETDVLIIKSMVSKAITSPIAIDITKLLAGLPPIAVIFVLVSGIIGAATATSLFSVIRVKSDISKGLAIGVSAHAIGTSRAIQISEECAAFSVMAMCLNGLATATAVVLYVSTFS